MEILRIEGISKHYGNIQALSEVSLNIGDGEILGILGPNGSGKTTLLGILLDIIHADKGTFQWFAGKYDNDYRLHIGAILETPNFYPDLDAIENLRIIQHIKNSAQDNITQLLRMVKLEQRKHSKFATYSLGMKQRLAIASTLIGNPQVLIFDEPTNGLDPEGIVDVRQTLQQLAASGKTIIMASHILDEVEKICSHVAILHQGKLIRNGQVTAILGNQNFFQLNCRQNEVLINLLKNHPGITMVKPYRGYVEIQAEDHIGASDLNQLAFIHGLVLDHLVSKKTTLEEEFLKLIMPSS